MPVYATMPETEYHATPALSASLLKALAESPADCWYAMHNRRESEAFDVGKAFHCLVLEPHLFSQKFAVRADGIDGRTKAGREALAKFRAESGGKTMLSEEQYDQAAAMATAVLSHPVSERFVKCEGQSEMSLFWDEAGTKCKARLDRLSVLNSQIVVDLKTAAKVNPRTLSWAMHAGDASGGNYGYALQAAWYLRGCQACSATQQELDFVFIFVRKSAPHHVCVCKLDPISLEFAGRECDRLVDLWRECNKTGIWPGPYQEMETVSLPEWAIDEDISVTLDGKEVAL